MKKYILLENENTLPTHYSDSYVATVSRAMEMLSKKGVEEFTGSRRGETLMLMAANYKIVVMPFRKLEQWNKERQA